MPMTPLSPVSYATLSAMITPAIFLTANGSLIISTSNRMSRVVDRMRVLNELADKLDRNGGDFDYPLERLNQVNDQLDRLLWRGDRIRRALATLYLAFGAFAGTSLTIAVDVWTSNQLVAVPTILAILGVGLMLYACVNLVREAFEALSSNQLEIGFYRQLQFRRKSDRGPDSPSH